MMDISTDIDIDFADRTIALMTLPHVPASRVERNEVIRHASGVYFQDIPTDPLTGCSAILYEEAADLGYFKIDFLNNSIYQGVKDEDHLDELVNREPEWSLLEDREIVGMLVHIADHFGAVQAIAPKSIDDLAVVLALIRPGKRHLMSKPRAEIDAEIWKQNPNEYIFKRSHSIAYALSVVVQLNLLVENISAELDQATP